jgi:hypothetical protein
MNNKITTPKSRQRKEKAAVYYHLSSILFGNGPGWELVNRHTLQRGGGGLSPNEPWPDGYLQLPRGPWSIPDYSEAPNFLIDRKMGRSPRDLEVMDGYFFVSAKMKAVFEAVDSSACEFRRCRTYYRSGEEGPETWLCSVTRAFVGAVDIEKSDVGPVSLVGGLPLFLSIYPKLTFKPEVIKEAHLFHVAEMSSRVICDQSFKDACKAAGVKGAEFEPIT